MTAATTQNITAPAPGAPAAEETPLAQVLRIATRAFMTQNIAEFLRAALANGPVPARDLQTRARAAELLGQDQPIRQCKSIRTVADRLGVKRFQSGRRWYWTLPAGADQVSHATAEVGAVAASASDAIPASDIICNTRQPLTKEFIKAHVDNYRAIVREAQAESKAAVERYLETGDLADLFPVEVT